MWSSRYRCDVVIGPRSSVTGRGADRLREVLSWEALAGKTYLAARRRSHLGFPRQSMSAANIVRVSLLFSCFVFSRIARADKRVRTRLDRRGKFLQVLRNVAHIVEQFVDVP